MYNQLSCDALSGRTKTTREKDKQLNTETFGEVGGRYHSRSYRGRGGRRRGRGNWRRNTGGN